MNPYTIGIVDSSQNKISIDIAYCNVYTKPLTTMQQTKLVTYVNTTFLEPHTASESSNTYVVTVVGSAFSLTGSNGVSSSSMLMTYGKVYILDQSDSSNAGKPLIIYTNTAKTNRYYTGVVANGTPGTRNAYTIVDLSSSVAGATLYYGGVSLTGGSIYTSPLSSTALVNAASVPIGDTFSVSFYSGLAAGTQVQYTISGISSADLNNALVTGGFFTAPSQVIQFTVTGGTVGNSISFLISGTVTSAIVLAAPFNTTTCVTWLDAATSVGLADGTLVTTSNISDNSPTPKSITKLVGTITYKTNGLKQGFPGYVFAAGGICFGVPANTFIKTATPSEGAMSFFAVYYSDNQSQFGGTIVTRTIGNGPAFFDSYGRKRIFHVYPTPTPLTVQNPTVNYAANSGNTSDPLQIGSVLSNPTLYSAIIATKNPLSFEEHYSNVNTFGNYYFGVANTPFSGDADTATSISIGTRDDGDTGGIKTTGVFSEVIIFNSVISLTDRLKIEGYLANKWALTASLPFGHPYKYYSVLPTTPVPLILYRFEEATVTNYGGSGNIDGSGTLINTSSYISYTTAISKYGTSSLYSSSTSSAGNSYLQVPIRYINSEHYPVGITISFWVMFQTLPTADTIVMGNAPDTAAVSGFVCYLKLNTGFQCYNTATISTANYGPMSTDTWYHYVQTYNPTTTIKNTYVNGSLLGSQTLGITSPGATINLVNSKTASYLALGGWLSNFRVYSSELTSTAVSGLYNSTDVTLTITVVSNIFYLNGKQNYLFTFIAGIKYIFDQSDSSNKGLTLVLCATSTQNLISYQTIVGTPGTSGAYTSFTATAESVAYSMRMNKSFWVKVQLNPVGSYVYAFSDDVLSTGTYYKQPKVSFYKGDKCTFNVSDPSNTGYTLKFGTVVGGTPNTSVFTQTGSTITLDIPEAYVGDRIQYYENSRSGMGYVTPPVAVATSATTTLAATNLTHFEVYITTESYILTLIGGVLYYSTDGGATFTASTNLTGGDRLYIHNKKYAVMGTGSMVNSTTGYKIFQPSSPLSTSLVSSVATAVHGNLGTLFTVDLLGSRISYVVGWGNIKTYLNSNGYLFDNANYSGDSYAEIADTSTTICFSLVISNDKLIAANINGSNQSSILIFTKNSTAASFYWTAALTITTYTNDNGIMTNDYLRHLYCSGNGKYLICIGSQQVAISNNYGSNWYKIRSTNTYTATTNDNNMFNTANPAYLTNCLSNTNQSCLASLSYDGKNISVYTIAQTFYYRSTDYGNTFSIINTPTSSTIANVAEGSLFSLVTTNIGLVHTTTKTVQPTTVITYYVKVIDSQFWLSSDYVSNGTGPDTSGSYLSLTYGVNYIFDQSHPSNAGHIFVFGLFGDLISSMITYQNIVGSPGSAGAYTSLRATDDTICYFSYNDIGFGTPRPLIRYTFETENGTVVANSGTAGTAGDGTIVGTGTPIITYNTTTFKRGSKSLYCNTYSDGVWYVKPANYNLSSYTTYCVWIKFIDFTSFYGLCTPFSFTNGALALNDVRRHEVTLWSYNTDSDTHLLMNSWNQGHFSPFEQTTTKAATRTFYDGIWRHLTITNGGGITNLYCDGIKNPNSSFAHEALNNTSVQPTNTNSFRIIGGAYQGTAKCYIDDYRIYNTILSDADIFGIYQNEKV